MDRRRDGEMDRWRDLERWTDWIDGIQNRRIDSWIECAVLHVHMKYKSKLSQLSTICRLELSERFTWKQTRAIHIQPSIMPYADSRNQSAFRVRFIPRWSCFVVKRIVWTLGCGLPSSNTIPRLTGGPQVQTTCLCIHLNVQKTFKRVGSCSHTQTCAEIHCKDVPKDCHTNHMMVIDLVGCLDSNTSYCIPIIYIYVSVLNFISIKNGGHYQPITI